MSSSTSPQQSLVTATTDAQDVLHIHTTLDAVHHGSASFKDTIINEVKTCMGTGCLALPYAAKAGGIVLHVSGLFAIGLWNIYAVDRLCQCLTLIPKEHSEENGESGDGGEASQMALELPQSPPQCHHRPASLPRYDGVTLLQHSQLATDKEATKQTIVYQYPPRGTSTYSRVAWYAFGPLGLLALDLMMGALFIGVVVAFVDATRGFLRDTPVTSGSDMLDALAIAFIIGPLSIVPDIGYLSRASAMGLFVLFASFAVIAIYGWMEYYETNNAHYQDVASYNLQNDNDNSRNVQSNIIASRATLNWLPEHGMDGVSQWFGCVVFGYGIAPLTYNFQESMAEPNQMVRASTAALLIVAGSYVVLGLGLYALFPDINGDVLRTLPSSGWLPVVVRLSMAAVVFVTAPLLILPCGQLVEGKLAHRSVDEIPHSIRALVRIGIAIACVSISVLIPGFVSVLSLVGCASVAAMGFVVPPLLYLRLRYQSKLLSWDLAFDILMLVWGLAATGCTSFHILVTIVTS